MKLDTVLGTEIVSDVLTQFVDKNAMSKALKFIDVILTDGRPACAPQAMGL